MTIHQQIDLPDITATATEPDPAPENPTEFNWNGDDSVVLDDQPSTAVYTNKAGGFVIRQERSWDQDEDSFVYLSSPEAVRSVIRAMLRELKGLGNDLPL
jgi:hypothetical protein